MRQQCFTHGGASVVERVLRAQPGTDWDDDGRLVGLGLTLRPTNHRFVVDDRTFYAWCATDTLYFPMLLGASAIVESTCPTSQPIHIEISPEAIESVAPRETVISQRHHAELLADVRVQMCDHGHFFASRHAANAWLDAHPDDGELLPVADAFTRCRRTSEELGWITPTATRSG